MCLYISGYVPRLRMPLLCDSGSCFTWFPTGWLLGQPTLWLSLPIPWALHLLQPLGTDFNTFTLWFILMGRSTWLIKCWPNHVWMTFDVEGWLLFATRMWMYENLKVLRTERHVFKCYLEYIGYIKNNLESIWKRIFKWINFINSPPEA